IETAMQTTAELLGGELGDRLSALSDGLPELVRRPRGAPSSWPDFRSLAAARWDAAVAVAV
ncbi:MAG TPA: hypothetical protein VGO14_02900, partial [Solirubrobacteraceae bacterium]|nr:hypothetical protein [Solirubrobacteraceae bacterium]